MPIGGKDAFLSKVTFRRESNWYSKTKQELKNMATIEERYRGDQCSKCHLVIYCTHIGKRCDRFSSLVKGATEQKEIDDAELAEVKKQRDEYYDELISKRQRIAELESFVERATALIEAEKAYREHLEAKEKNIINKAWRWMEENQAHIISESGVWLMWTAFEDAFRKAMEE